MNNTIADLSTTPASILDVLGQNTQGTANANALDDVDRAALALVARFYADLGGTSTIGGTGDAITLTTASTYQSLKNGLLIGFRATAANTGAATINVDSLSAKAIRRLGDTALNANDIVNKGFYLLRYDTAINTAAGGWLLLNPNGPDVATAAQFRANTADKILDTDGVWSAAAEVTLTDAATVVVDMSTFLNALVTLGGNRTLGNPTNTVNQRSGVVRIVQDATGSRTLSYSSNWKFPGGTAPTLTTAAGAEDLLTYYVVSSSRIDATLTKGLA